MSLIMIARTCKPLSSPPADGGRNGHSLHIGHGGRATEHAHVSREWRL